MTNAQVVRVLELFTQHRTFDIVAPLLETKGVKKAKDPELTNARGRADSRLRQKV